MHLLPAPKGITHDAFSPAAAASSSHLRSAIKGKGAAVDAETLAHSPKRDERFNMHVHKPGVPHWRRGRPGGARKAAPPPCAAPLWHEAALVVAPLPARVVARQVGQGDEQALGGERQRRAGLGGDERVSGTS